MADLDWPVLIKLAFGFVVLIVLALLARGIGLGNVDEAHSFGLKEVIQPLGTVFVLWATWAFKLVQDTANKEK